MKIGLIDYDAGNLTSVVAALRHLGADYQVVTDPKAFPSLDKIIVPGVGEARSAMEHLDRTGLGQAIIEFASRGKPFLGICLGSQIILDYSEERQTPGLGIVPGRCKSFLTEYRRQNLPDKEFKIPHIGWNQVRVIPGDGIGTRLFDGIPDGRSFYFDHGYYNVPAESQWVIGQTDHGITFPAAFGKDNLAAVQFHPEKSGIYGLRLFDNFLKRIS
ncbi:MAG: imidazole glycerol phosphate synthase subunit HisH [Spirochaetales bacterium]|nr:imidazole glycerol phosphate synthase subunit HisH [Spirochaetales bacterium]